MTPAHAGAWVALLALVTTPPVALAYRPFASTDAAVAEPHEFEIEAGYFNLQESGRQSRIAAPSLVVNYGLVKNWEAVAEFGVQVSPDVELVEPGAFLKGVVKEGVLQEKPGVSVAIEAGPLLPSTVRGERGVGFEGIGIVSARVAPVIVHVNGGGGIDRAQARPFAIWGVIGELPVHPRVRIVAEVNGESTQGESPNDSALLGIIWQPTSSNVFLDAGVRRGLTRGAPDWQATVGVTFGFSLPGSAK